MEAQNLCVSFRKRSVLQNISFSFPDRGCLAIAGPNGSGKSTLLSVLSGALPPDSGSFTLPQGSTALVPQSPALFEDLKVSENLALFAKFSKRKAAFDPAQLPLDVGSFYRQRVSTLSGGMKKRVSITAALLGDPAVLLLDEPCAALDVLQRDTLLDFITAWKSQKLILYVGHDFGELSRVADSVLILKNGVSLGCYPRSKLPDGADGLETAVRTLLKS